MYSYTQSDGEVHFSKEVCTTLADYSFENQKKRHEVREGQQTKRHSLFFFFLGGAHASVNLYYPLTEIKKGLVSGNYWHPVKRSGNNYAGSQAHHLCAVQYSFSQLCCSLILAVNTWSSTMPAQSDNERNLRISFSLLPFPFSLRLSPVSPLFCCVLWLFGDGYQCLL